MVVINLTNIHRHVVELINRYCIFRRATRYAYPKLIVDS